MEPVLLVLLCSGAAAAVSALGVLPLAGRERPPAAWLGWANATAAGAMLAAAYVLAQAGIRGPAPSMGLGALVGIGSIWASHWLAGTEDLRLNRLADADPGYGYQVMLVSSLHSLAEGIGIGVAMAADLALGTFVAIAIGLHNVPEATLLGAVFRSRGESLRRCALLAVIGDLSLVFAAVSAYAVLEAAPGALAPALGFSSGALIYLVSVDLLPESYEQTGSTTIALITFVAMGLVIGMQRLLG